MDRQRAKQLFGSVLLVEDNRELLDIMADVLRRQGFDVRAHRYGDTALEEFNRAHDSINILVTDLVIPGLDGIELVRGVWKQRPDLPAILTSGVVDEQFVRDELGDHPGIRFFRKPFELAALLSAMTEILGTAIHELDVGDQDNFFIVASEAVEWQETALDQRKESPPSTSVGLLSAVDDRVYNRYPLRIEVSYETAGDFFTEYSQDLGFGGVFIKTERPTEALHESVSLQLKVVPLDIGCSLTGTIVRVAPDGMAIQFDPNQPQLAATLKKILAAERQQRRLLLVEDDDVTFDLLREQLGRLYQVSACQDPVEAIGVAEQNRVDLVLTDLMMPNIDGIELCQRLRQFKHLSRVPLAILTAHDDPRLREVALSLGVTRYVMKPIRLRQLVDTVDRLLGFPPEAEQPPSSR